MTTHFTTFFPGEWARDKAGQLVLVVRDNTGAEFVTTVMRKSSNGKDGPHNLQVMNKFRGELTKVTYEEVYIDDQEAFRFVSEKWDFNMQTLEVDLRTEAIAIVMAARSRWWIHHNVVVK